jgi:hypothetical protein
MAGRKPGRDFEKDKHWLGVIKRWKASGLGQMEFCRREGLSGKRFYYWHRVLQRRLLIDPSNTPEERKELSGPVFLPVEVNPVQEPATVSNTET